jgi:hypothetical protein
MRTLSRYEETTPQEWVEEINDAAAAVERDSPGLYDLYATQTPDMDEERIEVTVGLTIRVRQNRSALVALADHLRKIADQCETP